MLVSLKTTGTHISCLSNYLRTALCLINDITQTHQSNLIVQIQVTFWDKEASWARVEKEVKKDPKGGEAENLRLQRDN